MGLMTSGNSSSSDMLLPWPLVGFLETKELSLILPEKMTGQHCHYVENLLVVSVLLDLTCPRGPTLRKKCISCLKFPVPHECDVLLSQRASGSFGLLARVSDPKA